VFFELKVVTDVVKHEQKLKKSIKKYGYFAEHNYLHYLYNQTKSDSNQKERKFKVKDKFYIEKDDFKKLENNKLYRLMDCLNFEKKGSKLIFHSSEHGKYKKDGHLIIHWLPKQKDLVKTQVLMPDSKLIKGLAEPMVKNLKENDVIQFTRFGFCRLDKKEKNKLSFWYTHK